MEEFKDHLSYRPESSKGNSPYLPLIYSLLVVLGIILGLSIARITADKKSPLSQGKYDKVEDIISFVKLKYVDTVNTEQLTDQAIEKMLATLDPHSVYIPRKDVEQTNESLDGNFEGIGI